MTHYVRKFVPYKWTEVADSCLITLKNKGLTYDLIKKMLGVSTVYQVKTRYKNLIPNKHSRPKFKPRNSWSIEEDEMLSALWHRNLTARQISISIGRSRNAVIGRAHRLKLPKRAVSRKSKKILKIAKIEKRRKLSPKISVYIKDFKTALRRLANARMEGGVTLDQLQPHHCRFIAGDPKTDHIYCGREVKEKSSFCPEHHKLCFKRA